MEDKYLAISIKRNDYVVACLSIRSLTGRWVRSPIQGDWPTLKFVVEKSPTSIGHNEVLGSMLKLRDGNEMGSAWIAVVSAAPQPWRPQRTTPSDIITIMFVPRLGQDGTNAFCTSRIRVEEDMNEILDEIGGENETKWQLTLVSQAITPIQDLPWYPQNVSHAGRMIALRGNALHVYNLASDKEQPGKTIEVPKLEELDTLNDGLTINTLEPWSEAITVGLMGRVSVIKLRTYTCA